jgi:maleate isomerase
MRDVLGWRRKFGVIGPSTNTIVQPDFEMMRPPGVTNHYSRIFTPNAKAVSNETFMAGIQVIGGNVLDAVRGVMTCEPDYLVMGMSSVTFNGGAAGADAFVATVEKEAGVRISVGSHSSTAALKAYGGVKRIAFLSPYYPVANAEVRRYFTESGFEVVRDICLQCKSWTGIAEVPPDVLRDKLIELNGNGRDTDAIIQVGTNLSMVRLAAEAEQWLGKPVIAINTATYWHALRANGITDQIYGLGRLLEEFGIQSSSSCRAKKNRSGNRDLVGDQRSAGRAGRAERGNEIMDLGLHVNALVDRGIHPHCGTQGKLQRRLIPGLRHR